MTGQSLELANEMRLVGISAVMGDTYIIAGAILNEPQGFLKTYYPGIFFWGHSHLIAKYTFKLLFAKTSDLGKCSDWGRRSRH